MSALKRTDLQLSPRWLRLTLTLAFLMVSSPLWAQAPIETVPEPAPMESGARPMPHSPLRFRIFQIDRSVDLQGRSLTAPREVYLKASEAISAEEWLGQRLQVYRQIPLPGGDGSGELAGDEFDELLNDAEEESAALPAVGTNPSMEKVVGELSILSVNGLILHARVTKDALTSRSRRQSGSARGVVMIGDFARLIPPPPVTAPAPRVRRRREAPAPFQRENMRWKL